MPFYEYKCRKCKQGFSALRAMSDRDKPIACPDCGCQDVERQVSTFATTAGGPTSSSGGGCGNGRFT